MLMVWSEWMNVDSSSSRIGRIGETAMARYHNHFVFDHLVELGTVCLDVSSHPMTRSQLERDSTHGW